MVSTREKRQSNIRFLSQLDNFDQDIIIGNTASDRQKNTTVIESTGDRELTVGNPDSSLAVYESVVDVKTLETCFNEKIDNELSNIVDMVEDRIQNAIVTAIDSIVAPKIELAIRSINASSGRDATSVTENSERGDYSGIAAPFENVSEKNNTIHVLNTNDETRNKVPDVLSELSAPTTHFDRQPRSHHSTRGRTQPGAC